MKPLYPPLVAKLCEHYEAWIVGSGADTLCTNPRDWDVMVPLSMWGECAALIPADAVPNTFGGWKCQSNGIEVDVWPGELSRVMGHHRSKFAWQPRYGIRLGRIEPTGEIVTLREHLAAAKAVMAYHNGHQDECAAACDAWAEHVCYQPESVQPRCSCGLGKAVERFKRLEEGLKGQ